MLGPKARRLWAILYLAVRKFLQIDGAQWARAFAFSAFLSLFPLMILLVTLASFFIDRDSAGRALIAYMESRVPINIEMQRYIFDAISRLVKAREQAGVVAFLILAWAALQCFTTLVRVTNRAWGNERYNWWRLRLKSLVLLGVTGGGRSSWAWRCRFWRVSGRSGFPPWIISVPGFTPCGDFSSPCWCCFSV